MIMKHLEHFFFCTEKIARFFLHEGLKMFSLFGSLKPGIWRFFSVLKSVEMCDMTAGS
tara:strand:+ start:739 stop:912 length:174 start_codon:yes stop_codon:yes gene_type:complete